MSKALFLLSLSLILMTSCTTTATDSTSHSTEISESDSLKIVSSILDEMIDEMYSSERLLVNNDTTKFMLTCCMCPEKIDIISDSTGNIHVNDYSISSITQIIDSVKHYFNFNLGKPIQNYRFAIYTNEDLEQIKTNIHGVQRAIIELKHNNADEGILTFKNHVLEEWKKRLTICSILQLDSSKVISNQSGIYLDYALSQKTDILKTVIHAIYELREAAAQKYLGESYIRLVSRVNEFHRKKDIDKLNAINLLIPTRIVDQPNLKRYKNLENYRCSYSYEGVPIPPPIEIK